MSLELVRAVLSHPNAAKIPADGKFGLGAVLRYAVCTDVEFVRMILSHPNAVNILPFSRDPTEGRNSLGEALQEAREENKWKMVDVIYAFLKKIGAVVEVVISPEDKAALLKIREALGSEGGYSISLRVVRDLSVGMQKFILEQLCQACGTPTGNIQHDGFGHILLHPQSLLPIIDYLTQ
jgi:hypothetical protein